MPLERYGVLKGIAVDKRFASKANNHYQILLVDEDEQWRVAVNVQSVDKSEVEYLIVPDFEHPIISRIIDLPLGFTELGNYHGLDYIRGNFAEPNLFIPLPMHLPGPDNDLNDKLDRYVQQAMADEDAQIYVFGEPWGPERQRDKIFGFKPGRGMHDVHMNQGSPGYFKKDNGIWQDGGLLFHFPNDNCPWVGIFLKFQSQRWHTCEETGHPLTIETSGPPSDTIATYTRLAKYSLPTTDIPDGLVRIIAALVNDTAKAERESVTLLNTSSQDIDLQGWQLLDSKESKLNLEGVLSAGECKKILVRPTLELSNRGGLITLLNSEGIKIHGVSYTKQQAQHPGWTVVF